MVPLSPFAGRRKPTACALRLLTVSIHHPTSFVSPVASLPLSTEVNRSQLYKFMAVILELVVTSEGLLERVLERAVSLSKGEEGESLDASL